MAGLGHCECSRRALRLQRRAYGWRAFAVLVCMILPQAALAGAWTLAEGAGQAILQAGVYHSDSEFGPSSHLYDSRPYTKVEVTLTLEYGATDWLTLVVAPQYLSVDLGDPAPSSYSGPGYTDAGARVRLAAWDSSVVSAQVVGRFSGTGSSNSAAAVGYQDPELDLRLLYGTAFTLFERPAFLDIQAAQRLRFGNPPDEFHLDATLGVRVADRWQVMVQSFNVVSEGAGEGPYFGDSYEYYKLQLAAAYDVTATCAVQLALVGTWFARNAPQENGVVASVLYRF